MSNTVPEGWEVKTVGDIGSVVTGSTPSTTDLFWGGATPFISPADFDGKIYIDKTSRTLSEEGTKKARELPKDAILVTCIGSLGGMALTSKPSVTNQQINAVVAEENQESRFHFYNILFNMHELIKSAGTTTLPIINKSTFSQINLLFPPLPEQQKIATILSSVDGVIEKTCAQIDKLKDLKTGMMQELLTKGIGHTEFKDSPVGRIPAEWTVKKLDDLSEKISDGIHTTPKYVEKSEYHFINGNNLQDGQIVIGDKTKCVPESEFIKLKRDLTDNTILMSINGTIGKLAFYAGEQVVLGKSAAFISLAKEQSKKFIFYVLQSQATTQFYDFELTGSTIKNLSLRTIKQTPVPIPTKKEQALIVSILSENDKKIRLKTELLNQVEALKKALMQDLLTGKVRVNLSDKESAVV